MTTTLDKRLTACYIVRSMRANSEQRGAVRGESEQSHDTITTSETGCKPLIFTLGYVGLCAGGSSRTHFDPFHFLGFQFLSFSRVETSLTSFLIREICLI